MGRDGIKIVEFDDDDRSPVGRPSEKQGIKIIEFDNDRGDGRTTVATAQDIGPIKIVEFDDDDGPSAPSRQPEAAAPPQPAAKAIKIRDFGAEAESAGPGAAGTGPKIKVMEFD